MAKKQTQRRATAKGRTTATRMKPSDLGTQTRAESSAKLRDRAAEPSRYRVEGEDFCSADLSRLCVTDRQTGRCYVVDLPRQIDSLTRPSRPTINTTITFVGNGWSGALLQKLRR